MQRQQPQTENKIILVTRRTRLEELVVRFNTVSQAGFYIKHMGGDFSDYELEDRTYRIALRKTEEALLRHGRVQILERGLVPNFVFGPKDTVLALGQDGLVANVLKYLDGQRLIGVNPDPGRWEGVLLPFRVSDLDKILPEALAGKRPFRTVTMARASLNTGEELYAVNDLFIGPRTHTSARYTIQKGKSSEFQSSSGIIVSTGLGSTGWLRSILAGAKGIVSGLGTSKGDTSLDLHGESLLKKKSSGKKILTDQDGAFDWDAEYLYFSVREPWPSTRSEATLTFGRITPEAPLLLVSHMPENGVIFSDGIESDFLKFNSGTEAHIGIAEKKGFLIL